MAAARAARRGAPATLVAGASFSLIWWFDSLTHWCWYSGRVGWLVVALVAPSVLALATRLAQRGARVVLALVVALLAVALLLVAEPAGTVFSSRAPLLVHDLVDVLSDGHGAEGNVRAAFRTLLIAAAAFALHESGRRDPETRVFGGFLVAATVVAYTGGYLPVEWPIEPYLLLVPASLVAAVVAADLLARAVSASSVRAAGSSSKVLLLLAALVAAPLLARTVLTYVPDALPRRVLRSPADLRVSALVGPNERAPDPMRHAAPPPVYAAVAARLAGVATRGRVLVPERGLAAYLAMRTELPIVGPLSLRRDTTVVASPARPELWRGAALQQSARQHGAEWVLLGPAGPTDALDPRRFELVGSLDAVRLYRVRPAIRGGGPAGAPSAREFPPARQ